MNRCQKTSSGYAVVQLIFSGLVQKQHIFPRLIVMLLCHDLCLSGGVYVTLSHEMSLKLHLGCFEMCMILKTAASADYFGIKMQTVVKYFLKLWLIEVAKHYGSHFEKTAQKDYVFFCIFSIAVGV